MKLLNYLNYEKISSDDKYVKKVFDNYQDNVITIPISSKNYKELKILNFDIYKSTSTNKPELEHSLFKLDKVINLKTINKTIINNYLLFYPDFVILSDTNGSELNRSNAIWTRKSITNKVSDWTSILIEYCSQFELLDANRKINLAIGTIINDFELVTLSISSQLIDEVIYMYISNLEICNFIDNIDRKVNPRSCKITTGWIYGPNITDHISVAFNNDKVYNVANLIGYINSLIYKASQICRISDMHGDGKVNISRDIQSNYEGLDISSKEDLLNYLDNKNLWRL